MQVADKHDSHEITTLDPGLWRVASDIRVLPPPKCVEIIFLHEEEKNNPQLGAQATYFYQY